MSSSNSTPKPLSISLSSSKNPKKPSSSSQSTRDTKSLPHRSHHNQPPSSARRNNHFAPASDSEDEDSHPPTHESVTTFDRDAGGAIGADPDKGRKKELVIKVESGNNWRDRVGRKRGKNLLPREVQAQREAEAHGDGGGGEGVTVEREGPSMEVGISYAKERDEGGEGGRDVEMGGVEEGAGGGEVKKPLTEDEIALHSLVNGGNGERRSDLVISARENGDERQDETTSFREDVASRPDMASLDQYAAVPVEEFGAALLRGMGWKEGQPVGRGKYGANDTEYQKGNKARVPERRPGYLGIGAKDIGGKKGAEAEIGAWGKAAMRKSKKDGGSSGEGLYIPVMMRQKNTGALITEEEFRAMSKAGGDGEGKKDDEWKERRDRNLEKDGRDRRRRDYDDDDNDDYERSERGSSRRDRSRSSDDKDRRRRRRDDSADRESDRGKSDRYYRDREKYRDRDRDRDSDRKHRDSRRHRDDYASSSSRSSRRDDRRDRDSDRESYRRKDRYGDDDRKRRSRRGEVY